MNKELSIDLNEVNEDINQIQEEEINPNLFINLYKNTFLSPTETLENSKFAKFIENPRLTYTLNKTSSTVTFTDNFFVSAILFTPEEDGVFELTYINLFDVKKTLKEDKKDKEGRIIFWTNDCVKQISLKFNNEKFFAKKRSNLEKFQLYGLTFNDAITQLNNFYQIKEDRKQYEEIISTKKEELVNKVEEITKKLNEYQEYLEAQEEHEAELNTNIEELKEQKKNLQNNINQHNAGQSKT
ncbi:coiled-coil domain-containing protein [Acinetobacter baumannii]